MLGDRFASNVFLVGKPDDDVGVAFSPIARLIAAFVSLAPKKAFSGSIIQFDCKSTARIAVGAGPECGLVQPDLSRVAGEHIPE